jgi:hypothetical protein
MRDIMGFWTGSLAAIVAVVAIAAASLALLIWRIDQDTVTQLLVVNSGGSAGKALVVYQPGLTDFPRQVTQSFTDGLVAAGWQVATTTASREATTALADYDLVVLGAPVYGGVVAKPLVRYAERVGNFAGKPVVLLLTGAGAVEAAIDAAEAMVAAANGRPIRAIGLTTMRPNDEENRYPGSNAEKAMQIARAEGQQIRIAPQ